MGGIELPKNPKAVTEERLSEIMYLSETPLKLEEQNRMWHARLPNGNPLGAMGFAISHSPRSHLGYPDKSLPGEWDSHFGEIRIHV